MYDCNCRISCPLLAIAASIIIGVITAFLTITAVITLTPAFLWVVLGIAIVYLAVTLISASIAQDSDTRLGCLCPIISTLLTGILGAILLAIVLLGIEFAATSIIGAIIAGGLLAFLSLLLTSTACLVKCLLRCND